MPPLVHMNTFYINCISIQILQYILWKTYFSFLHLILIFLLFRINETHNINYENHHLMCFNNHVNYIWIYLRHHAPHIWATYLELCTFHPTAWDNGNILYWSDHSLYKAPHVLRYTLFYPAEAFHITHFITNQTVSGFEHAPWNQNIFFVDFLLKRRFTN